MSGPLSMAVWDTDRRRGLALKEQLEMFSEREAALYVGALEKKTAYHDVFFLSFDECGDLALRSARSIRQAWEGAFIMLVNDRGRDITPCIRPSIRPSGVLFRPLRNAQLRDCLGEIADELGRLAHSGSDDGSDGGSDGAYIVKSEGASYRVPFRDILFFEASNKKVVVHTPGQEIGFYGSIESLAAALPPYFERCHRAFVVNVRRIKALHGADMELRLDSGHRVPLSRSRRDAVASAMAGKSGDALDGGNGARDGGGGTLDAGSRARDVSMARDGG